MTPSDAQRIEQLIQQLRKIAEWEHSYDAEHAIDEAVDLIEQQQREIERLRGVEADARRYRWLVQEQNISYDRGAWIIYGPDFDEKFSLDQAIDAALAATAPMRAEGT